MPTLEKHAQHDQLTPPQKIQYAAIRGELAKRMHGAQVRILPQGFLFQYPNEEGLLVKLADYISLERIRCPWFRFHLEIPPEQGPISLSLTADDPRLMQKMHEELEALGAKLVQN